MAKITEPQIEMVKVVYSSTNTARHDVVGTSRILGRPMQYGYRKDGDVFNVAVQDIILRPDSFLAWPCRERFIINGNVLENPCGEMEPEVRFGAIEDIPGIGSKIAERLTSMGILTPEDVLHNVDDEVLKSLPPRSRTSIKKWQEAQRKS